MIVVMQQGSPKAQVEHVCKLVREMKLKDHVIVGTERTVIAVIGDDRFKDRSALESCPGVDRVVPILAPYKVASRQAKQEPTAIAMGGTLGATAGGKKVVMIAGPCSVEDRALVLEVAHAVKEAGATALARRSVQAANQPIPVPGTG